MFRLLLVAVLLSVSGATDTSWREGCNQECLDEGIEVRVGCFTDCDTSFPPGSDAVGVKNRKACKDTCIVNFEDYYEKCKQTKCDSVWRDMCNAGCRDDGIEVRVGCFEDCDASIPPESEAGWRDKRDECKDTCRDNFQDFYAACKETKCTPTTSWRTECNEGCRDDGIKNRVNCFEGCDDLFPSMSQPGSKDARDTCKELCRQDFNDFYSKCKEITCSTEVHDLCEKCPCCRNDPTFKQTALASDRCVKIVDEGRYFSGVWLESSECVSTETEDGIDWIFRRSSVERDCNYYPRPCGGDCLIPCASVCGSTYINDEEYNACTALLQYTNKRCSSACDFGGLGNGCDAQSYCTTKKAVDACEKCPCCSDESSFLDSVYWPDRCIFNSDDVTGERSYGAFTCTQDGFTSSKLKHVGQQFFCSGSNEVEVELNTLEYQACKIVFDSAQDHCTYIPDVDVDDSAAVSEQCNSG